MRSGISSGIFLSEARDGRVRRSARSGVWKRNILILIASRLRRAILFFPARIIFVRVIPAQIICTQIISTRVVPDRIIFREIGFGKILLAQLRRSGGFHCRGVKIGKDRLLLDLTFAQGGEIIRHGFFFVEADLSGVGADETFIEDAAGKLVEVFVLKSAEHPSADFGGIGDGVERDVALLALLAKFFSKRSQEWLRRRTGVTGIIIGDGGAIRHNGFADGVTEGWGSLGAEARFTLLLLTQA